MNAAAAEDAVATQRAGTGARCESNALAANKMPRGAPAPVRR